MSMHIGKALSLVGLAVAGATVVQGQEAESSVPTGESLYAYHCVTCHGEGPRMPGTAALQLKYDGAVPALLTEREDLSPVVVRLIVRRGINAMPFFRKTEISDAELEAIADFLTDRGK